MRKAPSAAMSSGSIRSGARVFLRALVLLAVALGTLQAQGPPPGPRAPGISWWESPWWNGAAAQDLNLSDGQKNDINAIVKDYRSKMMDMRSAIGKADRDVAAAFAENPVDPHKANDSIEKLATARGDLTRALSQMSLKVRLVLTAEQWQELQQRAFVGRGRGKRERRPGERGPGVAPESAAKQ
jgi:Spy/CpxP family protein refolding chaperone